MRILLCVLLPLLAASFAPVSVPRSPTSLSYVEENEWYSPPPEESQPPRVESLDSHIDWAEFLENDSLKVVKFYARWCKSCQKVGLLYQKESRKHQDVTFAEVEWSAQTALCRSLGVKQLPTLQFYWKGQRLTSFSCPPSQFRKVQDALERFGRMSEDELDLQTQLEAGKEMVDTATQKDLVAARHVIHQQQQANRP